MKLFGIKKTTSRLHEGRLGDTRITSQEKAACQPTKVGKLWGPTAVTFFQQMHRIDTPSARGLERRVYLEMRVVFLGLLACSWVGVLHAQLVSPSMLHHGPLLTQVTLEGAGGSEVYHI